MLGKSRDFGRGWRRWGPYHFESKVSLEGGLVECAGSEVGDAYKLLDVGNHLVWMEVAVVFEEGAGSWLDYVLCELGDEFGLLCWICGFLFGALG